MKTKKDLPFLKEDEGGVSISVRLKPRSSRNAIEGVKDGVLSVKVTSAPVEGEANRALIEFLSEVLKIRKSAVTIESGHKSREKRVRVEGLSAGEALSSIERALSLS